MTVPRGYIGHPRDAMSRVADPNIRFGPFRVLPQTTGGFVVVDERRSMFDQVITKPMSLEAAETKARWFFQHEGRPT